ncbi:type II toxin-antitoxin system MqsR family toxin [Accumulibacter sp.]|uniref:type II toxin-antitoxin system MqsR family toxin n=1 Tax=Accumulibacter sp. TaxID=2053492 RepID=UPI001AD1F5F9|nr:type II toxin-antitoxin system MqsR family toxin [Accumulibacter sp.]MBN8453098.1 type II toxin-antitoxin system MqsR family toxin [Accumulibacter sp.]MBO3706566.1 type II toxin-antitoxin system MqsR family toxin [Candidatus Accumulibacter conexus]
MFEVFQPVRPRSRLSVVRALIVAGKLRITASAIAGAAQRGLDRAQMLAVLLALTPTDFHKSMTTYVDHTIRQEVYRPLVSAGRVSVKLTVDDELLIVSFKEL